MKDRYEKDKMNDFYSKVESASHSSWSRKSREERSEIEQAERDIETKLKKERRKIPLIGLIKGLTIGFVIGVIIAIPSIFLIVYSVGLESVLAQDVFALYEVSIRSTILSWFFLLVGGFFYLVWLGYKGLFLPRRIHDLASIFTEKTDPSDPSKGIKTYISQKAYNYVSILGLSLIITGIIFVVFSIIIVL
ncbi:MAG: hypothetical protein ACFFCZ_26230 [Promethearchaeota archaeon]